MKIHFRARLKDDRIVDGDAYIEDGATTKDQLADAVHDEVEYQHGQIKWLRIID